MSSRPQGRKRRSTFSNVASIESHGVHIAPNTTTAGNNSAQTERDQEYSGSVRAPHVYNSVVDRANVPEESGGEGTVAVSSSDPNSHVYYQITGEREREPHTQPVLEDDEEEYKDPSHEFAYGRRDSSSSVESQQYTDFLDHRKSSVAEGKATGLAAGKSNSGALSGAALSGVAQHRKAQSSTAPRGGDSLGGEPSELSQSEGPAKTRFPPNADINNQWAGRRTSAPGHSPLNKSYLTTEDYAIDMGDDIDHPADVIEGGDDYTGGFPGERRFVDIASDEEPLNSEPGSRRDSETSSLNDVCFPLDSPRHSGSVREIKIWPDLAILSEFAEQETKDMSAMNQAPVPSILRNTDENEDRPYSPFSAATDFNQRYAAVNEAETTDGLLRPRRFVPWANENKQKKGYKKRNSHMYSIPGVEDNDTSQYRFAYFREDMAATIHSPNISGLIQPAGMDFAKLFPPRISSVDPDRPRPIAPGAAPKHSDPSASSSGHHAPSAGTPAVAFIPDEHNGASTASPAAKADASPSLEAVDKQSFMDMPTAHLDPVPFWLDVTDPTEEEMKVISKAFGIHPLTTEDIFTRENREKVELFRNYYFVGFRSVDVNNRKRYKKPDENEEAADTSGHAAPSTSNRKDGYSLLGRRSTSNLKKGQDSYSKTDQDGRQTRRSVSRAKKSELKALNMYIIVFHEGVLTFHFNQTPHPMNVRRRTRLLKDYMTVSSDWLSYALIDDIVDGFAPMIEAIEEEVNEIEDAILRLHSAGSDGDSDDDDNDDSDSDSISSSSSTDSESTNLKSWKQRGDMLRRIGECRKRVMSLLRLLGNKADVIKGFAKRCNERWEVAPRNEIGLYLGDIQDHVVTMVQSLNHYEKLLARSHSNYLAQINIDMTKTNNDLNDVLSKITVLGTMVLPMNIVTGLWGMNVLVPGQDDKGGGLRWFWGIVIGLMAFALVCAFVTKKYIKFG